MTNTDLICGIRWKIQEEKTLVTYCAYTFASDWFQNWFLSCAIKRHEIVWSACSTSCEHYGLLWLLLYYVFCWALWKNCQGFEKPLQSGSSSTLFCSSASQDFTRAGLYGLTFRRAIPPTSDPWSHSTVWNISFSDTFSWEEYLKETSSTPASPSCFRQVCCPGLVFYHWIIHPR